MTEVELGAGSAVDIEVDLHAFRAEAYAHYDGRLVLAGDALVSPVRATVTAPAADEGRLLQWVVHQRGGGAWRFEVRLVQGGRVVAVLDERMGDAAAPSLSTGQALVIGLAG